MTYFANFSLESVTVQYTSGEDGEYTFKLLYNDQTYYIINTPQDVADGTIWLDTSAVIYRTSDLSNNQSFKIGLESREYDGDFRLGDGVGKVEKFFGINDKGLHIVPLDDDEGNKVEFHVHIDIFVYPPFGDVPPPTKKETDPSLRGIRVYEDWKYNAESNRSLQGLLRVRSQNFEAGDYNLPYEPEFISSGRFPFPVKALGVRPDSISSLKVGTDFYIELYDQLGQQGNMITLSENTPIMPNGWNDRVKSIRVRQIPVPR
jgi:hypothetical protein